MFKKQFILLSGFILLMAHGLLAQESQPQDTSKTNHPPATSMQWSNRDMTYRGKNYDVMDSAYYPKFRAKQFKK